MNFFLVIVVVALLLGALAWRSRRGPTPERFEPPSFVAARHLWDQVATVDAELAANTLQSSKKTKVLDQTRTSFIDHYLGEIHLEAIAVKGIGPKLFESLRAADIRTVADVSRIEFTNVDGVGEKTRAALVEGRAQFEAEAVRTFSGMSEVELDLLSGGQLSEAKEEDGARERQRARRTELLTLRRAELVRRAREAGLPDPVQSEGGHSSAIAKGPAGFSTPSASGRTKRAAITRGVEREVRCPRCTGTLKQRTGRHGPFVGCSNFPKCRYTQNGHLMR